MHFSHSIRISQTEISDDSRVYLIAEAGVNHGGDMDLARKLIDIAVEAGVDAVKFQSFKAEELIIKDIKKADYQIENTGGEETQFEMLKKLEISLDQTRQLRDYCASNGIQFLTTPFDEYSLDLLDELELPAYKISSTDITNLSFLKKVAQKGKPIFLSTGMAYLSEVELALKHIYPYNKEVVVLQCTANYPIADEEANLNIIRTYLNNFDILVGYSDHTVGTGAAPYSVAAGAKVIEKHFTLDKSLPGPDHVASLSPEELKEFVREVRRVENFMGTAIKKPTISELANRKSLQKCLVAIQPIKKGESFSAQNIIGKRTGGDGVPALYYQEVYQRKAPRDFGVNEIIRLM